MHARRTALARNGASKSKELVGPRYPDELNSADGYRPGWADLESLVVTLVSSPSLGLAARRRRRHPCLRVLDLCLLLVASLPPRIASSLARPAPNSSFRAQT